MQPDTRNQGGDISPELDELASTLLGEALDSLAEGRGLGVLLVVCDRDGQTLSYVFEDDGPLECLEAARSAVGRLRASHGDAKAGLGAPALYAIAYEGAVQGLKGSYQDALIVEFGEQGRKSYSAYCLIENRGAGDDFLWTEPAPAGELPSLL